MSSDPWPPTHATIKEAIEGDASALEAIYRVTQPRLAAFLRYQGFSQPIQEDIAADVSEAVLTKISSLRSPGTFEAWFWAITRNHVRGWLRSKQRDARQLVAGVPEAPTPDEILVSKEDHSDIRWALAALSADDRRLLWLREIEGLPYKAIGSITGASTGTVRVRCHRARQRLETAYEDAQQTGNRGPRADSRQNPTED
jgi:RNA polymerase sigma-70 factor, ECF subfamily